MKATHYQVKKRLFNYNRNQLFEVNMQATSLYKCNKHINKAISMLAKPKQYAC